MAFEMIEDVTDSAFNSGTNIKVIGVGGGGGNAVEHMIASGVKGVEFICANTDAQALQRSTSSRFVQLGRTGLGAGGRPQVGRDAAEQAQSQIRDALNGAHMLFITAGMGGGTGTGAAPVVARIAREMGILTVAVVTKPFEFEGTKRQGYADSGLEDLEKNVDSLIVVLNEKLLEVYGDDISQKEAFAKANDVLKNATGGIAEIINVPGLINADFEDVKTVMGEPGKAMMGTAVASGADRARLAAEQAVVCPLLDGVDLSGAKGVLVNITADDSLKLSETREAMNAIRAYAAPDAHIIFGTVNDPAMGDSLRVTVLATGLSKTRAAAKAQPQLTVLRTGTDAAPIAAPQALGPGVEPSQIPAIWRNPRGSAPSAHVSALMQSGMEEMEIPAFLRKQAD
ncbi:cell division protein FtsZ [mine drainage metagenome]|jgi:cell division protein FtsZ|uniref:Cell division protein FtsZ n=1 Tax=mine drainage metagenome TaxID=410659 RepID=A0A1J5QEK4_9ZZZZ